MSYAQLIASIKNLALQGEKAQVRKMLLLIELHESMLWSQHYTSWKALLKDEGNLCTLSGFLAFRAATQLLSEKELEHFGVRASAMIGRLPLKIRGPTLEALRAWWKQHHVPPQYQLVTQQIRKLHPSQKGRDSRVGQLLLHIEGLNRLLKRAGKKPPPIPPHPS